MDEQPQLIKGEQPKIEEIILRSTVGAFSNWLTKETEKYGIEREEFSTDKGPVILNGKVEESNVTQDGCDLDVRATLIHIWPDNPNVPVELRGKKDCRLPFPAYHLNVISLGNDRIQVRLSYADYLQEHIDSLLEKIHKKWPGSRQSGKKREGGPNTDTWARFQVFDRIKQEHPTWTQIRVAQFASVELGDPSINEDTVSYTYRSQGEPWPKGERTR